MITNDQAKIVLEQVRVIYYQALVGLIQAEAIYLLERDTYKQAEVEVFYKRAKDTFDQAKVALEQTEAVMEEATYSEP